MTALVGAASLLVGLSLGVLGGGGSILTVPILVHLAGQDAKEAITTSLFVVGVTGLAALLPHARGRRVHWRTGLLFGGFSMAGAYGGGRLAEHVPETVLLVAFALMMLVTAVAMLRKPRRGREKARRIHAEPQPLKHIAATGLAVGAVTGLVGSGGGFLVVPALAVLGGLPTGVAVGTSLLVIGMNSFAGLAGHLSGDRLDWGLALTVSAAAVAGSLVGGRLAGRIPQDALRTAFGWFVVAMGTFVLARQLGVAVWTDPALRAALGTALTCVFIGRVRRIWRLSAASLPKGVRNRP
ncbi:sulfite exporter TauE/SafE family protein [Streptomyces litmocidini]|uniref:sulfite exporter TauE/SafE family protein n=1 Tax=Streptomyces litmocidini TaxID=67318 RepID=UPI0036FCE379